MAFKTNITKDIGSLCLKHNIYFLETRSFSSFYRDKWISFFAGGDGDATPRRKMWEKTIQDIMI